MRFFEFKITESKGIFGRVPGDPYVHPDGRKAIFKQVIGLPDMTQGGGPVSYTHLTLPTKA